MQIGILGAGAIGCHVGGMLAAAGKHPVLVGRAAMAQALADGIELTGAGRPAMRAESGSFSFAPEPAALSTCDAVLVCVKSMDTRQAGRELARHLKPGAIVASLQNGVANAAVLQQALGAAPGVPRVLAGMVSFNVARIGANRFHRGAGEEIVLQDAPGALALTGEMLAAGLATVIRRDIDAVLWGKLLLNLNNAVNALSGLPLRDQLADRNWRRVMALCVREAMRVLRAAGIRPARVGPAPPHLIAPILELPDWLFALATAAMPAMDGEARTSMAQDLAAGRPSEVDFLNGEIVRLGREAGVATPVNAAMVEAVKAAFAAGRPPGVSGAQMLETLRR